jgi:hypothetical protein
MQWQLVSRVSAGQTERTVPLTVPHEKDPT